MDQFENQENQTGGYPSGTYESGTYPSGTYQTDAYEYGQSFHTDTQDGWQNTDGSDASYRPYEEPPRPPREHKYRKVAGKAVKGVSIALIFGVVAGLGFYGSTYFFDGVTGMRETAGDSGENLSGGDLHVVSDTEQPVITGTTAETGSTKVSGTVTNVSGIADSVMPSIVSITTISRTQLQVPDIFFGGSQSQSQENESESCGSGIIVSQDEENLYIATNNHVVSGAQTLTVLFSDGKSVNGTVKGTDASSDLAVVSVPLDDISSDTLKTIRTATFGDSSKVKVGETAIAIGNALGYGQSVTSGVISAKDREVSVQSETDGSTVTNELLQTDAAINPGNSGGALLNSKGEVIGINSVKYSETSVEGMGYAIPSSTAVPIIKQLITREVVSGARTAYLGISGVDVTDSVSQTYQMPQGVYVAQVVKGSGADQAGIAQGDIITGFDGRNVTTMEEIQDLMKYLESGSTVEVKIKRAENGEYKEQTLQVTLGSK